MENASYISFILKSSSKQKKLHQFSLKRIKTWLVFNKTYSVENNHTQSYSYKANFSSIGQVPFFMNAKAQCLLTIFEILSIVSV